MNFIIVLLTLITFIGQLTVINRVEPYVLGMPFNLFWCVLWGILTPIFLYILYKIDPENREENIK